MAHKVTFKAKGKRISFMAKGPAPKPGGKHPHAKKGDKKHVKNHRTGCTAELVFVGKGKGPVGSGWRIDSVSCPNPHRKKKGKRK